MNRSPSVLVAMSGGVDSSVAAALLHERGYRVLGSHLKLIRTGGVDHGCCGPQAEADAAEVARIAGFDFEIVDMGPAFERTVLADFFDEHRAGRTPNPCVRCNQHIKFGAFLDRADALGFDLVATGHYVRTWRDADGALAPRPRPGPRRRTSRTCCTSSARSSWPARCSRSAGRPRPRPARTPRGWDCPSRRSPIRRRCASCPAPTTPRSWPSTRPTWCARGSVVDAATGAMLGEHEGTFRYTIGQRRGLGVSTGERSYVVDVDPAANRVVVGPGELLARSGLLADRVTWVSGSPPAGPTEVDRPHPLPGRGRPRRRHPRRRRRGARVEFRTPQRAIAPGQSVVFYDGDEVLGGGRITKPSAGPQPSPSSSALRGGSMNPKTCMPVPVASGPRTTTPNCSRPPRTLTPGASPCSSTVLTIGLGMLVVPGARPPGRPLPRLAGPRGRVAVDPGRAVRLQRRVRLRLLVERLLRGHAAAGAGAGARGVRRRQAQPPQQLPVPDPASDGLARVRAVRARAVLPSVLSRRGGSPSRWAWPRRPGSCSGRR